MLSASPEGGLVNDDPTSGNRWERPEGTTPAQPPVDAAPPLPVQPVVTAQAPAPARATRSRLWIGGAVGAAVFLVGGAGGYGLAHAVSDDSSSVSPTRTPGNGFDDHGGVPPHQFGGPDDDRGHDGADDEGSGT